jgi:hypothetical protein
LRCSTQTTFPFPFLLVLSSDILSQNKSLWRDSFEEEEKKKRLKRKRKKASWIYVERLMFCVGKTEVCKTQITQALDRYPADANDVMIECPLVRPCFLNTLTKERMKGKAKVESV